MASLISVIMPVYNVEKYLSEALESLLNQTYSNIEIIAINDGSTDNSGKILDDFSLKDSRIKVIHQNNQGVGRTRNTGLKNASGKYVMFCDSDDWCSKTMCEKLLNTIEKKDVDLVLCDSYFFADGKVESRPVKEVKKSCRLKTFGYMDLKSAHAKQKIFVVLWNKIFKRSIILDNDITFPESKCEDDAFVFQYLYHAQSAFGLRKKLYNHRVRMSSIMSSMSSIDYKNNFLKSYAFLLEKLLKQGLTSLNDVQIIFIPKIYYVYNLFSEAEGLIFLKEVRDQIVSKLSLDQLQEGSVFKYLHNSKFDLALQSIRENMGVKKYRFLGLTYLKIERRFNLIRIYIFRLKVYTYEV